MGYPYTSDAGRPYTGGLGPDSPAAWWSSADVTNAPKPPLLPRYRFEAPVDVFVRQGHKPSVEVLPKQPVSAPIWSSGPDQHSGVAAQPMASNGAPVQYSQYNTYYNAPWVGSVGPGTVTLGPNGQLVVTSRPPHRPQHGPHPEGFPPPPGDLDASLPPRLLQDFPPEVMAALATLKPDGFDSPTTYTGTGQHRLAPGMLHQAWQASGLGLPPTTNSSETTGPPNTRPFSGLGASMPTGLSTYDPFTGKPNVPFDPITGQATGFWPFDPRNGQPVNAPGSLNPYGALSQGAAGLPRTALTNELSPAPVTPAITPPPPGPPAAPNPAAGALDPNRAAEPGSPKPDDVAKPRTEAPPGNHSAIMNDTRIKDLNDRLNSYNTQIRSDAALDLFKILEQTPGIATDPVYQPYIDAFAQKIVQDPSPLVRQPLLLAMELGYLKNPSEKVMGRLQNLVGENALLGIEPGIIDHVLSNVPMPVSPATNVTGVAIPREGPMGQSAHGGPETHDPQAAAPLGGRALPHGAGGISPDPAEMTATLLAGEPGTSAQKLPPNPYALGDLREPPGGLLDLTAMAEDPYIAPKKPSFLGGLFGPKQAAPEGPNLQELLNS